MEGLPSILPTSGDSRGAARFGPVEGVRRRTSPPAPPCACVREASNRCLLMPIGVERKIGDSPLRISCAVKDETPPPSQETALVKPTTCPTSYSTPTPKASANRADAAGTSTEPPASSRRSRYSTRRSAAHGSANAVCSAQKQLLR